MLGLARLTASASLGLGPGLALAPVSAAPRVLTTQDARGFHTSRSLRKGRNGVNEISRKKIKKQTLPHGHFRPHVWHRMQREKQAVELQAKFELIKDIPVIHYKPPVVQTWVTDLEGKPVGIVDLNEKVWNTDIRVDVVHRVVRWLRNMWRQGTHQAKNRSEVRGGGKKPHPQKGTGRARAGSIRSPLWRGGGNIFPPRYRSHAFDLPLKVIQMGMRCALSAKFQEGNMFVIRDTWLDTHKTADLLDLLEEHWKPLLHSRVAIIHSEGDLDPNFALAARNIWNLDFYTAKTANVYDIVKRHHLIVTQQALKELEHDLTFKAHARAQLKFPVEMPLVPLRSVSPIKFGRFKRKQMIHMRETKTKRDTKKLLAELRAHQIKKMLVARAGKTETNANAN